MTDIIVPDPSDPAGRLEWALGVLRHRHQWAGVVSGASILRVAKKIVREAEAAGLGVKRPHQRCNR